MTCHSVSDAIDVWISYFNRLPRPRWKQKWEEVLFEIESNLEWI